jgi:predicted GNAT superfamily acetyltransferase
MHEIVVRPLATLEEYIQAELIQLDAWHMADREVVPAHAMHAMQHNGAAVLGAFDGEQMVGFALGILATVEDSNNRHDQVAAARLKMFSVIAGVLPAYQKSGVGFQLKMAQREFAIRIGVRLITWTYDPLESVNARFNIGKLGTVCQTYLRHFHGDMGGINAGLPTDRFEVEWWVTSNRVQARAAQRWHPLKLDSLLGGGAIVVNEATFNTAGLPVPPPNYISHPSSLMLVEIPADMQAIKRADADLAQRWRYHTRDVFEGLFHSGFLVTDFVSQEDSAGHLRSYYLLAHQDG